MSDERLHRGETVSGLVGEGGGGAAPGGIQPPRTIGPYTLGERLGEGGFGAVFAAAQQGAIARRVAIKLLRAGEVSGQALARFRREQHVLAMMKHPHIAQVYDAGESAEGLPFIVMELVEGPSITTYCNEQKLGIRQRLVLFRQVCDAVQHAHVKGVIHRDIKPSNVLVARDEGRPMVKVIDFGIARPVDQARHAATVQTLERQLIGTPAYMSPEQARGSEDIDTRSDVYSLGVVLYELLAGLLPIDPDSLKNKSADQVDRIINEQDPPSPSTRVGRSAETRSSIAAQRSVAPAELTRILRGELDWVVMRCLEKSPDRRYQSAADLAADIERHLSGAAVVAAPPSRAYRFRKFARRHRVAVGAGAAVLLALSAGLVATLLALGEVRAQERVARREASRSSAFVKLFVEDALGAAAPAVSGGRDITVREMMVRAEERVASITDPSVRADVQHQLGRVYLALGEHQSAYEQLTVAAAFRETDPFSTTDERASVLMDLAWGCLLLERDDRGLAHAERALALFRGSEGEASVRACQATELIAEIQHQLGEREQARRLLLGALSEISSLEHEGEESLIHANLLSSAARIIHMTNAQFHEGAQMYERALEIMRRHSVPDLTLAQALANYAGAAADAGVQRGAFEPIDEAVEIARRALDADNPILAGYLMAQARVYGQARRFPEAEGMMREAAGIYDRSMGPETDTLAGALQGLGATLQGQSKFDEASECLRRSRGIFFSKYGPDDPRTLNAQSLLGDLRRQAGDLTEAGSLLHDAEERLRRSGVSEAVHALTKRRLAQLYSDLGDDAQEARWLHGG